MNTLEQHNDLVRTMSVRLHAMGYGVVPTMRRVFAARLRRAVVVVAALGFVVGLVGALVR